MRKLARIEMTTEFFEHVMEKFMPVGASVRDVRMVMPDDMSNWVISVVIEADSLGEVVEGGEIPLYAQGATTKAESWAKL